MATVNKIRSTHCAVERGITVITSKAPSSATTRSPTTLLQMPTVTSPSEASSTPTQGITGSNSPIIFGALGVAIVGLGIIIGIWYYIQKTSRNRALRYGEEVDPINLRRISTSPQQQWREKKLMTKDEVNERFPCLEYKNWTATRARDGLSTNGRDGVTVTHNRTASLVRGAVITSLSGADLGQHSAELEGLVRVEVTTIKDLGGIGGEWKGKELPATDMRAASRAVEDQHILRETQTIDSEEDSHNMPLTGDENEDELIRLPVLPRLLAAPGDNCAICLGILEQDDNIRGLTCGHAFHVECLDPWLTGHRACCPLCKMDYYVPKSVPEGEAAVPERPGRLIIGGYLGDNLYYGPSESHRAMRERLTATAATGSATEPVLSQQRGAGAQKRWGWRSSNPLRAVHIPAIFIPFRARAPGASAEQPIEPSPSQLEAGIING